jgi:hypothetical protein
MDQADAKFATRIVRKVLTEALPYLNIPMTEPVTEEEQAELDELREKVIERLELDEDEAEDFELDYYEAREFFKVNDEYMEKLQATYEECIDDMRSDYADKAEEILSRFEEEQEFIESEEKARENW